MKESWKIELNKEVKKFAEKQKKAEQLDTHQEEEETKERQQ